MDYGKNQNQNNGQQYFVKSIEKVGSYKIIYQIKLIIIDVWIGKKKQNNRFFQKKLEIKLIKN